MGFLKKLGQIIASVSGLFTGFAPLLQKELPGSAGVIQIVNKDIAAVADAVANAEALGQMQGMSGADKAKYLAPLVAQIVLSGSIVAGKKIQDQAKFLQGCGNLGGAIADIMNSLHEDSVKEVITEVKT